MTESTRILKLITIQIIFRAISSTPTNTDTIYKNEELGMLPPYTLIRLYLIYEINSWNNYIYITLKKKTYIQNFKFDGKVYSSLQI